MRIFKQLTANNIEIKPYPFLKELAMEAYLIENPEVLTLDNDNFTDVEVLDEEIALKKGRRDRDGRIDILASYGADYLSIIELKKKEINTESLDQLKGYLDQRDRILEEGKGDYWENEEPPKWIGILVGTSISRSLQDMLEQGLKHNDIPIAGIVLNRFRTAENNIMVVSETYFSFKYSEKDQSKFSFGDGVYNKGRLVHAVIQKFVDDNSAVTYSKLLDAFPNHLQGSQGVFRTLSKAEQIYQDTGRKRHYIKPSEVIILGDGEKIATSTQWGSGNINGFIDKARELGFEINRV